MRPNHPQCGRYVSRRDFLRFSAILAGLAALKPRLASLAAPSLPKPKVVHVHCPRASNWNFSTGWWGNYVD